MTRETPLSASRPDPLHLALLTGLGLAAVAGFRVPVWLLPLELLNVAVHEGWHGAVALLTGGTVVSVEVTPSGGGSTHTTGGLPPLILLAGYPGAMWSAVAVLVASRWQTAAASLLTLAGVTTCLLALVWKPAWLHPALFVVTVALVALAWAFKPAGVFLGRTLGTFLFCRALVDVVSDALWTPDEVQTDAVLLALGTGIPEPVWSVFWLVAGVAVLVASYRSWARPQPG